MENHNRLIILIKTLSHNIITQQSAIIIIIIIIIIMVHSVNSAYQ